tara:strand:- start:25492 stop:25929 length:438 start_codon:yes stop_codon:yes gene_type:complete
MMTVPQKKYFCKRIDEITNQKVSELKDVEAMSNKAIAAMGLANGKIRYPQEISKIWEAIDLIINDGEDIRWGSSTLGSLVIEPMLIGFSEFKHEMTTKIAKENSEIVNQRNKLYEEATRIKDVAMFGSEEAAHAMLKDFIEWQLK